MCPTVPIIFLSWYPAHPLSSQDCGQKRSNGVLPWSSVKIWGLIWLDGMMLNRLLSTPIPHLRLEAPGKAGGTNNLLKASNLVHLSRSFVTCPFQFQHLCKHFKPPSNHHPPLLESTDFRLSLATSPPKLHGFLLLLSRDGALNDLRGQSGRKKDGFPDIHWGEAQNCDGCL